MIPYVLPPNNALAAITSLDQPESIRRGLYELDVQLQNANHNNTPGGAGAIRGWGAGRSRGYGRR